MSGRDACLRKCLVDFGAARETFAVSDDRPLGKRPKRKRSCSLELVTGRHDDTMMPRVVWKRHEFRDILQRLRRNSDVCRSLNQHPRDLAGAALMQHQMHIGKLCAKVGDNRQKRIARLRMGRRNVKRALVAIGELLTELFDIFCVEQNAIDDLGQLFAGFRQSQKPLAATYKKLDTKLVLEILDVLRNTGL